MAKSYKVPDDAAEMRIDAWLHQVDPEHSRNRWQNLIKNGDVRLDGAECKPSTSLHGGEEITVEIPPPAESKLQPEDIPLNIIFEDAHLLVLDKQAGLVVHPAPGHPSGTLVNAILHHCGDLRGIGGELRPGIVHRLDKDTSGALVVAKNGMAMEKLSQQFKSRTTQKEYLALVWGIPSPPFG